MTELAFRTGFHEKPTTYSLARFEAAFPHCSVVLALVVVSRLACPPSHLLYISNISREEGARAPFA